MIVALLVFVALLAIGEPLLRKRGVWLYGRARSPLANLEQRRDELLRALKDLENEHDASRLDDAAYERQRAPLFDGAVDLAAQIKQRRAAMRTAREAIESELQGAPPAAPADQAAASEPNAEAAPRTSAEEPAAASARTAAVTTEPGASAETTADAAGSDPTPHGTATKKKSAKKKTKKRGASSA